MTKAKKNLSRWMLPSGILDLYSTYRKSVKIAKRRKSYTREEFVLLKENAKLKDRHAGQRCFVLGAGSSIKNQDITKLAGEIVLSVSNVFVHPAIPLIRPKYHILPPVLTSHSAFGTTENFIEWFAEMDNKTYDAEMFFHIGDRDELIKHGLYRDRIVHWVDYVPWDGFSKPAIDLANIPDIWSVSETAITVAMHLGFSEIYLLGFDHDWFNGPLVYFYDEKKEHILKPDKEKLPFVDSEFQMRRHADIFRKYKYLYSLKHNIFNANSNPNSYVDVFPKVSLTDVLKKQRMVS